jgi:hypothetical protein
LLCHPFGVSKSLRGEQGLRFAQYPPGVYHPVGVKWDSRYGSQHYGFTEEELDFIINYDIKYRMGDELND